MVDIWPETYCEVKKRLIRTKTFLILVVRFYEKSIYST